MTLLSNTLDRRNEVDLELIELMKESPSYNEKDESAMIQAIGIEGNEAKTQRLNHGNHGFTPISFR